MIAQSVASSRFTATVSIDAKDIPLRYRHRAAIKIEYVRLRRRKDYCGQHPGPCLALFRRHRKSSCLEGTDWVAFNDLLNDVLDALGVDADVFSFNRESMCSRYYIRRGTRRLTNYLSDSVIRSGRPIYFWRENYLADFEDWCDKEAPASTYPDDTPGYYAKTLAEEEACRAQEETAYA